MTRQHAVEVETVQAKRADSCSEMALLREENGGGGIRVAKQVYLRNFATFMTQQSRPNLTARQVRMCVLDTPARCICYDPDGTLLAVGLGGGLILDEGDSYNPDKVNMCNYSFLKAVWSVIRVIDVQITRGALRLVSRMATCEVGGRLHLL